ATMQKMIVGMMKVQRGSVIDQPEVSVPDEHVRVAGRAIDIRNEGIEPDDSRRQPAVDLIDDRIEGNGAGQIVEPQIQAAARADEILDFGIGLCASQLGVELDEDNLGYAKSEGARDPSRDELGHEHFLPLPRPAKLE